MLGASLHFFYSLAFHQVKEHYPFIVKYHNAWPVYMLIHQYLNNYCNNLRVNAANATPAITGPTAAPAPDLDTNGGNDGDQGDEGSNVTISDLDD